MQADTKRGLRSTSWREYWLKRPFWIAFAGKILTYVLNLNLPKVKSFVLEVGCGKSKGKQYKKWIGLDLERTIKPTVVGDVHYLPFRGNAFALVYSHGLVEHLENADLALSQMLRVGKCVFFSIPSGGGFINWLHNLFDLMNWRWIFPPERYYPDDSFPFKRRKIFRAVNIYEIRRNCTFAIHKKPLEVENPLSTMKEDPCARYKVGVVIPALKESENLEMLIPKIFEALEDENVHCFVADDYSGDGTKEMVSRFENAHYIQCSNRGFAKALSKGLEKAIKVGCEYVIQMDADFSHSPQDIPKLLQSLRLGNDLILGVRPDKSEAFRGSMFLRLRSTIASNLARIILGIRCNDVTTGFHGFSKRCLDAINPKNWLSEDFEVEVEIVYRAFKNRLKIDEVPITVEPRSREITKKRILEPLKFVLSVIKMKIMIRWKEGWSTRKR